jgi:DNA-binding NarL/FixJ family response regulator
MEWKTSPKKEDFSEEIRHIMQINLEITILFFSLYLVLPVAWAALRAGARGFLHASMEACQVVRAVDLATKGVLVAPRKLLEYLVNEESETRYVNAPTLTVVAVK